MAWSIKKSVNLYKKVLLISAAGLIKVTFIELSVYVLFFLLDLVELQSQPLSLLHGKSFLSFYEYIVSSLRKGIS